ncbi:amylo-alpha-1,6-glucosidase [Chthonomonas calidirosea]|uniref:amylo-alpha-1,6-glucosidase n=1 Tax=Chthonomonas calidirosea TaxID=454171 RepID=UPI0006ECB408|nr:hypothetical protein [Chthonomonas calidirosea]CEK16621.1 hypothetical protein CP488_01571 [Chthonomonas calidirosea]
MELPTPHATALRATCVLETPDPLINYAFQYAKDNIARCMRYYTLGWGMSNCPHATTIVVGRDTGWMCLGTDYVAPWFAPEALRVFRRRQKPNGQIIEYVDLESGAQSDYNLNVSDNTPLYLWALAHHWQMHPDEAFREEFAASAQMACEHLLAERGPSGLLVGVPAGTGSFGTCGWRNIIEGYVQAGEVTEINALAAMALRQMADFLHEPRYLQEAQCLQEAINTHLWTGSLYLLNRFEGKPNPQVTGDMVFPVLCGVASDEQARAVLTRLSQPDFWSVRGMRTLPNTDPQYHPERAYGLLGGSWPNLTLWYAAAVAPHDPDTALNALRLVAQPVVEAMPPEVNVHRGEFAEFFHGETGVNLGMHLSPWVAPTFIWAVLEGLVGLKWQGGEATFAPHWPYEWREVTLRNVPTTKGPKDYVLKRE